VVEAEGWAAETAGDPASRVRAIAAAQKRAVEEAAGVSVAGMTRVDGAIAVRQRIVSSTSGRVESWSVLKEWVEGGLRKIRIRAVVVLGAPVRTAGQPPAGVKVEVIGDGASGEAVRRALTAGGFELSATGAEYVVRFRGAARPVRDARLGSFASSRARVSLVIADAATGAVVWERAEEASALGDDDAAAAAQASSRAAEAVSRDAVAGLTELAWTR
jgi:leucyl aminopeptidase (aminopeptidase T)